MALVGVEVDGKAGAAHVGDRDDVPDIFRDDVEGEEVDLGGEVGASRRLAGGSAGDGVAEVGAGSAAWFHGREHDGGLDLHPLEASAVLDDEVVAGGVAPGLGDGESVMGGAGHELQLDPLAAFFGMDDGFHDQGAGRRTQEAGNSFARVAREARARRPCLHKHCPHIFRIAS